MDEIYNYKMWKSQTMASICELILHKLHHKDLKFLRLDIFKMLPYREKVIIINN